MPCTLIVTEGGETHFCDEVNGVQCTVTSIDLGAAPSGPGYNDGGLELIHDVYEFLGQYDAPETPASAEPVSLPVTHDEVVPEVISEPVEIHPEPGV